MHAQKHTHKHTYTPWYNVYSQLCKRWRGHTQTGSLDCLPSDSWWISMVHIEFHSLALGSERRNRGESGYWLANPAKLQQTEASFCPLCGFPSQFPCNCYSSRSHCLFISEWAIHLAPTPIVQAALTTTKTYYLVFTNVVCLSFD